MKQPVDGAGHGILAWMEAMVQHAGHLFFLSSRPEDMHGYRHGGREIKQFHCLDLSSCEWEELPAPGHVQGNCRLVSHSKGLYAIDRYGRLENYVKSDRVWTALCVVCPFHFNTLYFLPIVRDCHLYMLRAFPSRVFPILCTEVAGNL